MSCCKGKNHFKKFCEKSLSVHSMVKDVCCELEEITIGLVSITNAVGVNFLCATLIVNHKTCVVQVDTGCQ